MPRNREEKPPVKRGIQSLEVGLGVLEALAALGEPVPLGAVVQATGLAGSQAHRYLTSLVAAGMAQQDPASGRYDLGPAALKLGLGALARIDAFRAADRAIGAFVRETGRTVQLAALGPMGPTIVRWHMGRPAVMTSFNVGAVLPLLTSATGQIFLSFANDGEIDALVEREMPASGMTEATVAILKANVRKAARAHVSGTMVPGLDAVAFPIFDLQGRVVLSATLLTSAQTRQDGGAAQLDRLAEVCRSVSISLGWSGIYSD